MTEQQTIALPSADRIGQATAVEQSRAVAEVQAAVVVAQQVPRDVTRAIEAMRETCGHKGLADKAFFRFPRAGQNVTGPSIHLARELARVWGNVQYGINELRRDDVARQSEMIAWAWDVQANIRSSTTFIVPHARDTKGGVKPLIDLRDVYENNANNGSRRVREMIFAVLPTWFVDEAKDRAAATVREGGGVPLPQRIANTIEAFARLGVDERQLSAKVARRSVEWTDFDVAALAVIGGSLKRGETTTAEEFPADAKPPTASVTVAELTGTPAGAPGTVDAVARTLPPLDTQEAAQEPPAPAQEPEPAAPAPEHQVDERSAPEPEPDRGRMSTQRQHGGIFARGKDLGLDYTKEREEFLANLSADINRIVTSIKELTFGEASMVIELWDKRLGSAPGEQP